jgi:hypothetical protein
LLAAEGSIVAVQFMHGEAVFMWAAPPIIPMRVTPAAAPFIAVASMPGAEVFTPAVVLWQAAEAPLPADGAWLTEAA